MASVLTAPAAGATPSAVPDGWEVVEGVELQGVPGKLDASQAPSLTGNNVSAQAAEAELLAVQSVRNSRFVATEVNYPAPNTGLLRARSAEYGGSWEGFAFQWDEVSQTWSLRSLANDLYVAVEKNFTGDSQNVLRARSASVGGWEQFHLFYNEELQRWSLQSTLNGLFVAMENSYSGSLQYALRARSTDVGGSWEQFVLYNLEA
ncbi:hypothetical protein [Streptomyces sp. NPDC006610]|uniref:fascin domain-containing protein n=1 Tax=Streptomyces sp. NPDC006610 TaxID=3154584 RepID=UPI0033BBC1D1